MMNDSEDVLTVDKLFELLEKLKYGGYGDMLIKCGDVLLHDNEVGIRYCYPEGKLERSCSVGIYFINPLVKR